METMRMESVDMTAQNIDKIAELFPNCISESKGEDGKLKRVVNFDLLRQMLSEEVQEGDEAYEFTWVGKKAAIVEANKPIRKTLRPCPEESVDWDNTENLYIEGDNLEVLKMLQESYLGAIKMIYIDPPYNTGNDFIYRDSFSIPPSDYDDELGTYDDEGNRLFKNTDSNGRFHSDWCSMLYSRLLLSRNLLRDDGVIFISIGQDEEANLTKICDEVFGTENKLGIISHQMKAGGGTQGKFFAHNVDYILAYAKKYDSARYFRGEMSEDLVNKVYNQIQKDGQRKGEKYRTMGLYQASLGIRPSLRYYIQCPDGSLVIPPGVTFPKKNEEGEIATPVEGDGCWRWSYEKYQLEASLGNVEFKKSKQKVLIDQNGNPSEWNVYTKIWLSDRQEEGTIPNDFLDRFENRHSSKELSALKIPFDFAKPVGLIKYLISIMRQSEGDIVLDFFSGSATTAHAVMQINSEDNLKRKFIMVQLPELCEPKSVAGKAGFPNICEIGKERIRRAAKDIKDKSPLTTEKLDSGFRVFKVADSNMTDVFYAATEYRQDFLGLLESNIKEDRNALDLLYGCILEWGLPLSLPYKKEMIDGCTVHVYNDGDLIACFDENLSSGTIKKIANMKPLRAVFRDSCFKDSPSKINVTEIFKLLSSDTTIKVL